MAKFRKGQLVVLARPEEKLHLRGAIGEISGVPGEFNGEHDGRPWTRAEDAIDFYVVHTPGYKNANNTWLLLAKEYQLDPLRDDDNRTAEEGDLVFNPKKVEV